MSAVKTAAPAKKSENKTWKLLAPIVVLVCICLIVTAALAGANQLTAPVIANALQEKADAALQVVLPEGSDFTDVALEGLPEIVTDAKQAGNGAGFVFTMNAKGFGDTPINVMVGLDADGKIAGTYVVSHTETSGIGTKVVDEGSDFQQQLVGMGDTSGIVATSGATFSSKGMTDAVQAAFDAYTIANGGTVEVQAAPRPETLTDGALAEVYPGVSFTEVPGGLVSDAGVVVFAVGSGMGDVPVAVFFDPNGAILGIHVDASHETPGIGTLCGEAGFTDQFKGVSSADEVDGISGSTVTSDAVKSAVNDAIANFETIKGAA